MFGSWNVVYTVGLSGLWLNQNNELKVAKMLCWAEECVIILYVIITMSDSFPLHVLIWPIVKIKIFISAIARAENETPGSFQNGFLQFGKGS